MFSDILLSVFPWHALLVCGILSITLICNILAVMKLVGRMISAENPIGEKLRYSLRMGTRSHMLVIPM